MPSAIEKDVYRSIALFSFFRYPLTSFEVWKWLYKPEQAWGLYEVIEILSRSDWLRERVAVKDGFYGLRSKESIEKQVARRHRRFLNAAIKEKKLRKYLPYLTRLPGVLGVAVCNSLSIRHTTPRSDIDLFIITKRGFIWSTRFWSVLPLMLLRQRPSEAKRDPIDTSFFVTEDALNLFSYKCAEEDPYLAWWICALVPVFERGSVFSFFIRHNAWAFTDFPNVAFAQSSQNEYQIPVGRFPKIFSMEWLLRRIQKRKIPSDILQSNNVPGSVVISDQVLKFHKNDRRMLFKQMFYDQLDS